MTDEDRVILKATLVTAARRLRHYETGHRNRLNDYLSMIERQKAEQAAEQDAAIADLLEGYFRKMAPEPLAGTNGTDSVPAHGDATNLPG